jgi:hypothetical protein
VLFRSKYLLSVTPVAIQMLRFPKAMSLASKLNVGYMAQSLIYVPELL